MIPQISLLTQCLLITVAASQPSLVQTSTERKCHNKCDGSWSDWNSWSSCRGGKCHQTPGKQSRYRACHVRYTESPPRGDIRDYTSKPVWIKKCIQKEEKPCHDKDTCKGSWGSWGPWTACTLSRDVNATCIKSRHRDCLNSGKRVTNLHCFGGLLEDRISEQCSEKICNTTSSTKNTSKMTGSTENIPEMIPRAKSFENPRESKNTIKDPKSFENPRESKDTIKDTKSFENPRESKDTIKDPNQHTLLILAVSIGALVFGVVLIILIVNVIRRRSKTDFHIPTSQEDDWKKSISMNTASSYVAASDILPSRVDYPDIRSPSSMTVTSGASTSSSSNPYSFVRNDSVFLRNVTETNEGTHLNAFVNKPRRSRLMQENVYWEISDTSHMNEYEDENLDFPLEPSNDVHHEVANVLYDVEA